MEILNLINSMSPYLLLGFLFAGLMHVFIPTYIYKKHLGKSNFPSVLYSTLIAIPLPLCSCGVIPVAMSLRKEGASKSSVISFLIATPQTGIDSILATYSLMGLPFAIIRPIAALFTALFGGTLSNILNKDEEENKLPHIETIDINNPKKNIYEKIKEAFQYAYVDMMQDIGKWLVIGLVLAGLITVYVPDEFFSQFANNSLLSILIVLIISIPMYLCATGSIPIAVALMMKGLTPGAGLVLLMAGPAINIASMLVIGKVMGKRSLFIYLASIILGAILFALGIDYLLPREWFTYSLSTHACCTNTTSIFQWICTGVLILLLINALLIQNIKNHKKNTTTVMKDDSTKFIIKGMKCNHCKASAENAIKSVKGVTDLNIDLATGEAIVNGSFKKEDIITAVSSIGFEIE